MKISKDVKPAARENMRGALLNAGRCAQRVAAARQFSDM
jgi:hypothetical protein